MNETRTFLIALASFAAAYLHAANPAFTDFNTNQFGTANNKVALKDGVQATNPVVRTNITVLPLSSAGASVNNGNPAVMVSSAASGASNIVSGIGVSALSAISSGSRNQVSVGPSLVAAQSGSFNTGTNIVSGGATIAGLNALSHGLQTVSSSGSVIGAQASGGTNTTSGNGQIVAAVAQSGGLNVLSGNNSIAGVLANGGTNRQTNPGILVGTSANAQSLTASGNPSFLFAQASSTFGSAAATADNSFFIGGGDTNSTAQSAKISYGGSNFLHQTQHGTGIGKISTNAIEAMLDVLGKSRASEGSYLLAPTNSFTGPTNQMVLGTDATYTTLGDVSVTNLSASLTGGGSATAFATLGVFNNSGSNTTLTLTLTCLTADGARSYTLTNGILTQISVRKTAGYTNLTVQPFF